MHPGFRFRFQILTIGSALVWILAAGHGPLLFAADEVIYWSADLRIYRSTGRQGAPTVVLTNLDEEGNRLEPEPEESGCNDVRRQVEASQPLIVTDRPAQSGRVSVIVNSGEGSAQPGGEVEGAGYEGGVVVVNINNLPPPVEQQAALPVAYPMFTYVGLPGPFRYPDHLFFLGYGLSSTGPSLFSGLGLKAGNHFGLKPGR